MSYEGLTMRSMMSIVLALAASLLDAGCISNKPVHYYTLGTAPPPTNRAKPDGPVLLVGSIATPERLQDDRIRYRAGANEAGAYEYHRWTERPGSMVRDAVIRALRDSGKYQRVLLAGSLTSGDYLLRGRLTEFDEVDQASIRTRISMHVELVDLKTSQTVWDDTVEREEPVGSKTVDEVVQSLDRNLTQVANETADRIDKFLTARVPGETPGRP